MRYFYDATGICGFSINGKYYAYFKDIFNNVTMLLENGLVVAKYVYDAFGNCKVLNPNGTISTDLNFIGNLNPIRWKCHYYDEESGFYYANCRYYDPTVGKYLDADDIVNILATAYNALPLDRNGVLCYNVLTLQAYIYTVQLQTTIFSVPIDEEPNWFERLVDGFNTWWNGLDKSTQIVIGAGVVVVVAALTAVTWGGFAAAIGVATSVSAVIISGIVGGAIAGVICLIDQAINNDNIGLGLLALNTFWGATNAATNEILAINFVPLSILLNMGFAHFGYLLECAYKQESPTLSGFIASTISGIIGGAYIGKNDKLKILFNIISEAVAYSDGVIDTILGTLEEEYKKRKSVVA